MNESKWLFTCIFGLQPETCGKYARDDESRGAHFGYGGCASCLHREPDNAETATADDLWWFETRVFAARPAEATRRP